MEHNLVIYSNLDIVLLHMNG